MPTLTITERATAALREILLGMSNGWRESTTVVHRGDGGIAIALDSQRTGDQVVHHDGQAVLLIDQVVLAQLAGKTLDTSGSDDGKQLLFI